jgi:UDP:flavonoid glycosyltransferase YjiC (YdhE family)
LAGLTGGMAEIVVGTTGTWGDVFPAVGLPKGLKDAGHTVRVAAPPSYRELVEGEDLSFSPIGPPLGFDEYAADPKILSGRLGGFAGPSGRQVLPQSPYSPMGQN